MVSAEHTPGGGHLRARRLIALSVALTLAAVGAVSVLSDLPDKASALPPNAPATTYLESSTSFNDTGYIRGNGTSTTNEAGQISGNGRWVAFEGPGGDQHAFAVANPTTTTDPSGGGTGAPSPRRSIWIKDRLTGTATEITPRPFGGSMGNDFYNSFLPTISRDGCFVAFITEGYLDPLGFDDFPSEPNMGNDVYRWGPTPGCPQNAAGATAPTFNLISIEVSSGFAVNNSLDTVANTAPMVIPTQRPSLSADGRFVSYVGKGEIHGEYDGSGNGGNTSGIRIINGGYSRPTVLVVDTNVSYNPADYGTGPANPSNIPPASRNARTIAAPDRVGSPPVINFDSGAIQPVVGSFSAVLTDDGTAVIYSTDANPFVGPPTANPSPPPPTLPDPMGGWAVVQQCGLACFFRTLPVQVMRWTITPYTTQPAQGTVASQFRLISRNASATGPDDLADYSNGRNWNASISANGNRVAFSSDASNLPEAPAAPPTTTTTTDDTPPVTFQVYAYDLTTNTNRLVSQRLTPAPVAPDIPAGDGPSGAMEFLDSDPCSPQAVCPIELPFGPGGVSISGDGRFVAFHSEADDLDDPDTASGPDGYPYQNIWLGQLSDATGALLANLELVNVNPAAAPAAAAATRPTLSSTGRYVAFDHENANVLVPPIPNPPYPGFVRQVFVHDRLDARTSAPDLNFGSFTVGSPSPAQPVTLTNTGGGSYVFQTSVITGAEFAFTGGTCTAGLSLAPGASCTFNLIFTPTSAITFNGNIQAQNDPTFDFLPGINCTTFAAACIRYVTGHPTATLTGTGLAPTTTTGPTTTAATTTSSSTTRPPRTTTTPAPTTTIRPTTTTAFVPRFALRLEPPSADFGLHLVGQPSAALVFQLRNIGNVSNTISTIATAGINSAEFVVTVNGCAGVTLPINAACPITVVHTPLDSGGRAATLVAFGQGGSTASSVLIASGIYQPTIRFNPGVVIPGRTTFLVGSGFPTNTPVTLSWVGLNQPPIFTATDAVGGLRLTVYILPNELTGTRQMAVADQPGRFVSVPAAPVLVALPTYQPQVSSNPAFRASPEQGLFTRG